MGPLAGLKVIEFEGIGPGPLAGMILADMGAEVTLISRKGGMALAQQLGGAGGQDILKRGKYRMVVDLKHPEGVELVLQMLADADALIEGNRPGVMERLGLGPEQCLAANPRLVYGRMTGWGQNGPLAQAAGHDLNYIALTGMLGLGGGRSYPQRPPATLAGDAVGALGLAFGFVCAVFEARASRLGQVVDASIVDMTALLGSIAHFIHASGQIGGERPSAFYDSPFYDLFQCADGEWITLAPLEPQFYAELVERLQLTDVDPRAQYDIDHWPALKARLTELFLGQPRAHWCSLLEGTDVCFAPVLSPAEAAAHPHNVAREVFRTDPVLQANPAPRFSRTPGAIQPRCEEPSPLLAGIAAQRLEELRKAGVLG
ncbi:alpha-methylacyl-CoA racemase [Pseudomonas citronellolis]|uniref:CaiB/BaiF CoA transferase family protein n=1 Tax=Pseudomonas citronellolis TaxID=53408 RepID=UPI00209DF171|nr:CaiB/BaiF CoA-transferase family protein [Pseudomonas citronellolis]MCP1644874.1 alpha-methylacyl-CoA racemase [Pseudomonas citronellolis]MCP1667819.1 alpha-methylacyl-CoA racemase [Pseudomonas citronellolis]MCP1699085.1 alpha-methylacyl-CoA racemase [Pseudomonas citronellolis]MCP1704926.1 alpha-methylacyl-CoA racemase [Pseudomonas citronellolis]MCP1799648.1 alpha-methylacyl-CoA racemase [Pseudomonas citronellolis]